MMTQALHWREMGIATIPIKANSKIAAVPWKRYQKELPYVADMSRWFRNTDHNLAVICGNGLVVIDFDDQAVYREWRKEHRDLETYEVRTRRGFHLYFFVAGWNGTRINKCDSLDIKAEGGYVLAPPSVVNGHQYQVVTAAPILKIDDLAEVLPPLEKVHRNDASQVVINGSHNRVTVHPYIRAPSSFPRKTLYRGVIQDIKGQLTTLDLACQYTTMLPSGNNAYLGRCPHPDHEDVNPSFRVVSNRACCFKTTCRLFDHRAMDVLELHSRLHDLTLRNSILLLADELGLV